MAARLVETHGKGMETLVRARTAGKQTITIKQAPVNAAQVVIADTVTTGGRGRVPGGGDEK